MSHSVNITIRDIKRIVSDVTLIPVEWLEAHTKRRNIARPRMIAMKLARDNTSNSFPVIGEAFGGRDHTTVINACRRVNELSASDPDFDEIYRECVEGVNKFKLAVDVRTMPLKQLAQYRSVFIRHGSLGVRA